MSAEIDAPAPPARGRKRRWRRDPRVWLLVAVVAYTFLGFVVLPWVAARQIVGFVAETLGRHASLERVRFNPYTFKLHLENFSAEEPDGTALLSFGELFADLELSSLVRESLTFAEIRLSAPKVNFVRLANGDNNLSRALAPLASDEPPAETEKAEESEPFALLIRRLALEAGEMDVTDLALPTRFETHLGPISFEVRDFGTLPDRTAEQRFELVTESGARLEWTGTMGMNPLRSAGHVSAKGEKLRLLWRYLQDRLGFEITDGTTALALDYELEVESPEPRVGVRNLELTVEKLAVRPKGEEIEVFRLPSLAVKGGRFDLGRRAVHVDEVRVQGVRLDAWRDEQGALNLIRMLEPAETKPTAAPPPGGEPKPRAADLGTEAVPAEADSDGSAETSRESQEESEEGRRENEAGEGGDEAPAPDGMSAQDEGVSDAGSTAAEDRPAPGGGGGGNAAAGVAGEWSLTLDRLLVEDFGLAFADRTMTPPLQSGVQDLQLEVRNVSTQPGTAFDVDLAAVITTGGRVKTTGKIGIAPLAVDAEVKVDGLSLVPVQPFLADVARLRLESANLSIDGHARSGADESFAFDGRVALTDLSTEDTLDGERFLAWKALSLSDLAVRLDGRSLAAPAVEIQAPYAKVFIAKDGSTNVGDVFASNGANEASTESAGAAAEKSEPFAVTVGKISIRDGSANFADLSLPLPFETGVHSLGGEVSSIQSGSSVPTRVKLRGTVSQYGEARIDGKLNAFEPERDADVHVVFRNLAMTSLTPYSAKFAGYRIREGKLTVELHYRLKNRKLEAGNRIIMDQLTLGDRVESPDAIDVPLGLAIALLKDSDGRIDLDLPVSGSLDDPQFSYGKAIRDTIKNLLLRAVTAPFGFLASIVGAGDDNLKYVFFEPGSATLAPPEREKLAKLAEALAKRPQLALEVRGRYAKKVDGVALRTAKVVARVEERLAGEREAGDEARREALEDLFRDEFSGTELENLKAANTRILEPVLHTGGAGAQAPLDEEAYRGALTAQLAGRQPLADADLIALADARARAIADFLAATGTAHERLQLSESGETKRGVDGRVRVALGLKKE
jgi:flagellar motor protein MotB